MNQPDQFQPGDTVRSEMYIIVFDGMYQPISKEELMQQTFDVSFGDSLMVRFDTIDGEIVPVNAMDGWGTNVMHTVIGKLPLIYQLVQPVPIQPVPQDKTIEVDELERIERYANVSQQAAPQAEEWEIVDGGEYHKHITNGKRTFTVWKPHAVTLCKELNTTASLAAEVSRLKETVKGLRQALSVRKESSEVITSQYETIQSLRSQLEAAETRFHGMQKAYGEADYRADRLSEQLEAERKEVERLKGDIQAAMITMEKWIDIEAGYKQQLQSAQSGLKEIPDAIARAYNTGDLERHLLIEKGELRRYGTGTDYFNNSPDCEIFRNRDKTQEG